VTLAAGVGGCGADGGAGRAGRARELRDAGLKFARCMRENGIDMPDPQASGTGGPGEGEDTLGHIDPSDPGFKQAEQACSKYLQGGLGVQPTKDGLKKPGDDPEAEAALLKVARCMREQGIDFPDPRNGAVNFPDSFDPDDPAFKQAQEKCKFGEFPSPGH
jgi:hypothetical protein